MPLADQKIFWEMLDRASQLKYAYPAINVTSIQAVNAVLRGLAESKSDGIIQVSTSGAAHISGTYLNDMALGAIVIAEYVHRVADRYPIYVALHTDHCPPEHVEKFLYRLIEETESRRKRGLPNLFNGHMFDGSSLPLDKNLEISLELLERMQKNELVLEIEVGVVGGEEDGIKASIDSRLYTNPEETLKVAKKLNPISKGKYLLAAAFGNVHGVYKPGNVKLKPEILKACQERLKEEFGKEAKFYFVFHGGSGSSLEEIHEAIEYGVVKMNIDTDTQYAFTRAIADHVFKNYDGVLKVDGEVGKKKAYDPRTYMALAELSMAERVKKATEDLKSQNKTLYKG
ncbi:MAG: class II fructose-bisphosphate aldolase [Desulfobacterota bacterium]|nr:class II fructose-bisphosphate aldolase [Thermodesulfobacteriota bacterium]MDW8002839.1 class II fructose-bisphosphate aldolase [Deltaproteobacteria bacterium]